MARTNIGTGAVIALTVSITVGAGGVPAGNLIVVEVQDTTPGAATGTMSDTAGNTYTLAISRSPNNSSTNGSTQYFYAWNCAALVSGNTIVYTGTSGTTSKSVSAVYTNEADNTADPLISAVTTTATGTSATLSVTSGVPGVANAVFFACVGRNNPTGAVFTQDTAHGWSNPPNDTHEGSGSPHSGINGGSQVNATNSALTFAPGWSTTANQALLIIAFNPASSTITITTDMVAPVETAMLESIDVIPLAETGSMVRKSNVSPVETGSSARGDILAPVDPRITVRSDDIVPLDFLANLGGGIRAPIEERINISIDYLFPEEQGSLVRRQEKELIETSGSIYQTVRANIEMGAGVKGDLLAPIEWAGSSSISVTGRMVAPIEWLSSIARDMVPPVASMVSVLADLLSPLESGLTTSLTQRAPVAWGLGVLATGRAQVEWGRFVIADLPTPVEMLQTVYGLNSDQIETLQVVSAKARELIEWQINQRRDIVSPLEFTISISSTIRVNVEWSGTAASIFINPAYHAVLGPRLRDVTFDPRKRHVIV